MFTPPPPVGRGEFKICETGRYRAEIDTWNNACVASVQPGEACPETRCIGVKPCTDGYSCRGLYGSESCQATP